MVDGKGVELAYIVNNIQKECLKCTHIDHLNYAIFVIETIYSGKEFKICTYTPEAK